MLESILIVPGLGDSGPGHWQTWLEAQLPGAQRVRNIDWGAPVLARWATEVRREIDEASGVVWLVAHSYGCLASIVAAADRPERVAGLLLVAPPDPQRFMDQFTSWEIASRTNKWAGRNATRWHSEEYDRTWKAAESEMDPVKRAALFIKMNDLAIQEVVVIPVVWRPRVAVISHRLRNAEQSGWDSDFWNLPNWYREG